MFSLIMTFENVQRKRFSLAQSYQVTYLQIPHSHYTPSGVVREYRPNLAAHSGTDGLQNAS